MDRPPSRADLGSHPTSDLRHCQCCGSPVRIARPTQGKRLREVCRGCGKVQYNNPTNVVGTLTAAGDDGEKVLLCRRAIEPQSGLWTLPAGFMELGETLVEGALRETQEEAGANVEVLGLFALFDIVPAGQVHFLFRARMQDQNLAPGPETLEARLFEERDVPWSRLAFVTVEQALRQYFHCRKQLSFPLFISRID